MRPNPKVRAPSPSPPPLSPSSRAFTLSPLRSPSSTPESDRAGGQVRTAETQLDVVKQLLAAGADATVATATSGAFSPLGSYQPKPELDIPIDNIKRLAAGMGLLIISTENTTYYTYIRIIYTF
jgi:hypothetical protein